MTHTWSFALICDGIDDWTDEVVGRLEKEADDAVFGRTNGVLFAEFDRESESAVEAITTAIASLEEGWWPELRVTHVEPDDLVTMADIAERLGRSRESVRLWILGERGPGGFPQPSHNALGRSRLWRWGEVLGWCRRSAATVEISDTELELAAAIDEVNHTRRAMQRARPAPKADA